METLYFTLGILSALIVLGVIGIVRVWNKVSGLSVAKSDLEDYIGDVADDMSSELEKLHQHFETETSHMDKELRVELEELQKYFDSRLDKLENKIEHKLQKVEGTLGTFIVQHNK